MKYGVREICDVVLRAKSAMKVGSKQFYKNEPVLYFDTLTTSSLEGAATTSYATGGRGNTRILAWEGERTLTFNMTDALISAESFAVLSGADVVDASAAKPIFVHSTSRAIVGDDYRIEVPGLVCWNHKASLGANDTVLPTASTTDTEAGKDQYNAGADIFIMALKNGEVNTEPAIPAESTSDKKAIMYHIDADGNYFSKILCYAVAPGETVLVDYYTKQSKGKQIEITPDKFGGYFYLEASTLFRDEATGQDLPAEFIIPKCKVQSNFTFTMAATGDPSTFDFVLDAFPDYNKFDPTKEVLAVLQVIEDVADESGAEGQRAHVAEADKKTAAGEEFEHKSFYAFNAANTEKYAESDDTVATAGRRKN